MRAVVQRVLRARVTVDDVETGAIDDGLLIYLAIGPDDASTEVEWMARKLAELRLFPGPNGFLDRSVEEAGGAVLLVSQFTLYADTRRGRRPDFTDAARPEVAAPLIEAVATALRARSLRVAEGRFGAHMVVDAVNDGPVTILLDSADLDRPRRS